jgi:hypothetical protein
MPLTGGLSSITDKLKTNTETGKVEMGDIDHDTFKKMFSKKGLTKAQGDILLNHVEAERSLYLFSKENQVRIFLFKIS